MKPYALKLKSDYLVGIEIEGAPCAQCVTFWLADRDIIVEPTELGALHAPALNALTVEYNPALFYEVTADGENTRLECFLEPHSKCHCQGKTVQYPNSQRLNYSFSEVAKLGAMRYAAPSGHLWVAHASTFKGKESYAVSPHSETARSRAVAKLKGDIRSESIANSIVNSYSERVKQPMLVVGCHTWMRNNLPAFMLQQYDIYMFFYPNSKSTWVVGAVAVSLVHRDAKPIHSYAAGIGSTATALQALHGLLALAKPENSEIEYDKQDARLTNWFTQWVYKCPK